MNLIADRRIVARRMPEQKAEAHQALLAFCAAHPKEQRRLQAAVLHRQYEWAHEARDAPLARRFLGAHVEREDDVTS